MSAFKIKLKFGSGCTSATASTVTPPASASSQPAASSLPSAATSSESAKAGVEVKKSKPLISFTNGAGKGKVSESMVPVVGDEVSKVVVIESEVVKATPGPSAEETRKVLFYLSESEVQDEH
jgi:hypothetical protein